MSKPPGFIHQIQLPHVNINLDDWRSKLQQQADSSIAGQIQAFFRSPYYTQAGSNDDGGEGHRLVKDLVEKLALDDAFKIQIVEQVESGFNDLLKTSVKEALAHIVRGQAFRIAVELGVKAAQEQL